MTVFRSSETASSSDSLREALRLAASALKAHGPPFALAGSYALWVHGGPEPVHDVDFAVAESDVDAATATLETAGFTITRPPEDWLFKAGLDSVFVDVLHAINDVPVDAELIRSGESHEVLAIRMHVLSPTLVLTQKLCALHEHSCDFAKLLPAVRAVRERVDWEQVRANTATNDFAVAFFALTDRLGITSAPK
ncbi:MAG TPA: hypothetical protein VMS16_04555 [Mycobacterium sp.]|nr:hypothetical protein [Mycobacterium sp.]